jgi:probable F420-dependent oxidoreductase
MTVAHLGWDLQQFSGGRFNLGLGSQVKAHIERRFSMPWSEPAARMREFITAVRTIWDSWQNGTKLTFEGDFYRHTLMTPFFTPEKGVHGTPRVYLAAVGERMTQVAAQAADGLLVHPFTTEQYLRDVTMPTLKHGLASAGRDLGAFEVSLPAFIVTGRDEAELRRSATSTRRRIAFYGATPAYRRVLDLHGWGDLQSDLNQLSSRGEWAAMGERIDDTILAAFAVVAEPDALAQQIVARFGGIVDRLSLYMPGGLDGGFTAALLADLRKQTTGDDRSVGWRS